MPDLETTVRTVNAVLAGLALLLLAWRAHQNWTAYTPRTRLIVFALFALLFTGCFGSLEAMHSGIPLGFRSYMAGCAYVWIIVALTVTPKGLTKQF